MFPHAIYTIGYGQRSPDELLVVLRLFDIAWLLDVRSQPWSRKKPEFNRPELEKFLRDNDIHYLFLGDQLGGRPDDPALRLPDGRVDQDRLAVQSYFQRGLDRLATALQKGHRVCVLCAEQKPEQCHRFWLIGRELVRRGLPVRHIDEKNDLLPHEEVMLRYEAGQMNLFHGDQHD